jgi:hypothetical protein
LLLATRTRITATLKMRTTCGVSCCGARTSFLAAHAPMPMVSKVCIPEAVETRVVMIENHMCADINSDRLSPHLFGQPVRMTYADQLRRASWTVRNPLVIFLSLPARSLGPRSLHWGDARCWMGETVHKVES